MLSPIKTKGQRLVPMNLQGILRHKRANIKHVINTNYADSKKKCRTDLLQLPL